jgi:PAS domain-containing protein
MAGQPPTLRGVEELSSLIGPELERIITFAALKNADDAAVQRALSKTREFAWSCGGDPQMNLGISEALAAYTGTRRDEWQGGGWLAMVHPDDRQRVLENCQRYWALRVPFSIRYRLRHVGGRYGSVIDYAEPRFSEDGSFAGYIGLVRKDSQRAGPPNRAYKIA